MYKNTKNTSNARKKLSSDIRSILRNKGYSISGWSRANGYNRISVHLALSGQMNGRHAREIRTKVENLKG